jgi:hypothetical protein
MGRRILGTKPVPHHLCRNPPHTTTHSPTFCYVGIKFQDCSRIQQFSALRNSSLLSPLSRTPQNLSNGLVSFVVVHSQLIPVTSLPSNFYITISGKLFPCRKELLALRLSKWLISLILIIRYSWIVEVVSGSIRGVPEELCWEQHIDLTR